VSVMRRLDIDLVLVRFGRGAGYREMKAMRDDVSQAKEEPR
jgi:hypothetical protein